MGTTLGKVMKAIGIAVWVLGFAAGFLAGKGDMSIFSGDTDFNPWAAINTWFAVFASGMLYFAIGIFADKLAEARNKADEQTKQIDHISKQLQQVIELLPKAEALLDEEEEVREPEPIAMNDGQVGYLKSTLKRSNIGGIICPKCGMVQRANRNSCFGCGTVFID